MIFENGTIEDSNRTGTAFRELWAKTSLIFNINVYNASGLTNTNNHARYSIACLHYSKSPNFFLWVTIQNISIKWNHVYVYKQLLKSFAPFFVFLNLLPDAIEFKKKIVHVMKKKCCKLKINWYTYYEVLSLWNVVECDLYWLHS